MRAVAEAPGSSPRLLVTSHGSERAQALTDQASVSPSPCDSETGTTGSLFYRERNRSAMKFHPLRSRKLSAESQGNSGRGVAVKWQSPSYDPETGAELSHRTGVDEATVRQEPAHARGSANRAASRESRADEAPRTLKYPRFGLGGSKF